MTSNLRYLLEPDEREHAVSIMREWIEHGDGESCAATLERLIVSPLGDWIESQADTGNNLFHAACDMMWAAQGMANRFRYGRDPVTPEHVSDLNAKWQEFQILFGHLALLKIPPLLASAAHGRKFKAGRKPGTGGPIRKRIAALLKKNPRLKNPELWETIKNAPPRGWQAFDNRLGEYLEGPGNQSMTRGRFDTVCGEERKKITG